MAKRKQVRQKQNQPGNSSIWSHTIVVAIISAIALIVVALINRSTSIVTTLKPIEATQTAEAQHTTIAMTELSVITFMPTEIHTLVPTVAQLPTTLPTSTLVPIGETIKDLVWLRAGPGENYYALAFYNKGIKVEVLNQSEDGNWLNVLLQDGSQGWMPTTAIQTNTSIWNLPIATDPPTQTPQPYIPPNNDNRGGEGGGGLGVECVEAQRAHDAILKGDPEGDLNGDGLVDIFDWNILVGTWPGGCPTPIP